MPKITSVEFNIKITFLLQNKDIEFKSAPLEDKDSEAKESLEKEPYKTYFDSCKDYLSKKSDELYDDIVHFLCEKSRGRIAITEKVVKLFIGKTVKDDSVIEEQCQELLAQVEKMLEFFQSPLAKNLESCLRYEKSLLLEIKDRIKKSVHFPTRFQHCLSTDKEFCAGLHPIPEDVKEEAIEKILLNYKLHIKNTKIELIDIILKSGVRIISKWIQFLKKNEIRSDYIYNLALLFFEYFETATPEKIEQVIDFGIHITKHVNGTKNSKDALEDLLNSGLREPANLGGKPWTIEGLEKRFKALQKIDQHIEAKEAVSAFDHDFLKINETFSVIFEKHPRFFWRIRKYDIDFNRVAYSDADNIVKLFDLCEAISPDDVTELVRPIFYAGNIEVTSERIAKLIEILSWIRVSILKNQSAAHRERMSGFTDRIFALLWDNPKLADEIFTLPADKYEALCELMLTKTSFVKLTIQKFSALFKKDQSRFIDVACLSLEKIISQDASLEQRLHYWLNTIIKIHNKDYDKSKSLALKEKLAKLPMYYLRLVPKMIDVTQGHPQCVEQFLGFATALPFSETLNRYLNNLKIIPSDHLLSCMVIFNELISDNPDLLPQLLSNLNLVVSLKKLKEVDRPLCLYLVSKYSNILKEDCLEQIISDVTLRSNLAILIKAEIDYEIPLASIFLDYKTKLPLIKNPLLEIIVNNAMFARQLSYIFSNQFLESGWWESDIFTLSKMLESNPKVIFELFEMTQKFEKTLVRFIKAMREDTLFPRKDIAGKDQALHLLLIDFYRDMKDSHPEFTQSILWLIENKLEKLALTLLTLYKHEDIKPHLPLLFDLIGLQYISRVETFLEKLEKKADPVLLQKEMELLAKIKIPDIEKLDMPCELEHKSTDIESLEKDMLSFMNEADIKSLNTQELDGEQRIKLTLGIGQVLISSSGNLNIDLIDAVKATNAYKNLEHSIFLKAYLDRVLEVFTLNAEFSERLKEFSVVPIPLSHSELIVRKMLHIPSDKAITANHAKILILGTLLCPVRQGSVSSCFATSVIIQAASHKDGLLQILDDYLSMLSTGRLYRAVEYPMLFNFEEFAKKFENENLLSRAYEYLVATMAAGDDSSLQLSTKKHLSEIFCGEAEVVLENLGVPSYDMFHMKHIIKSTLSDCAEEFSLQTYNGHAKHSLTGTQGAWILLDRDTFQPLCETKSIQENFYAKIFKKAKAILVEKYPEFKDQITETFDKKLIDYIQSSDFTKKLFYVWFPAEKGLIRLNSSKYYFLRNETPYAAYGGGHPDSVLSNYHGQSVITERFPLGNNPFMVLDSLTKKLSEQKKIPSEDLLTCSTEDHTFNLRLKEIKQKIIEPGIKATQKKLQDAAEAAAKSPLTAEIADQLISCYVNNQTYSNKNMARLHYKMLHYNDYVNLGDLCQEIARTDRELMGENRISVGEVIDGVLRVHPHFQDKMPAIYHCADTNWESTPYLVLSCSVLDRSIDFGLRSSTNQAQIMTWSPGDMWRWTFFRFPKSGDTFSRSYSQSKPIAVSQQTLPSRIAGIKRPFAMQEETTEGKDSAAKKIKLELKDETKSPVCAFTASMQLKRKPGDELKGSPRFWQNPKPDSKASAVGVLCEKKRKLC